MAYNMLFTIEPSGIALHNTLHASVSCSSIIVIVIVIILEMHWVHFLIKWELLQEEFWLLLLLPMEISSQWVICHCSCASLCFIWGLFHPWICRFDKELGKVVAIKVIDLEESWVYFFILFSDMRCFFLSLA